LLRWVERCCDALVVVVVAVVGCRCCCLVVVVVCVAFVVNYPLSGDTANRGRAAVGYWVLPLGGVLVVVDCC